MKHKVLVSQVEFVIDQVLNAAPKELKDFLKQNTFLAGGCFRSIWMNKSVSDYDFYFKTKEARDTFKKLVDPLNRSKSWQHIQLSKTSITFLVNGHYKVQFITKWIGSPKEIVDTFDFKHTQYFYNLKDSTHNITEKSKFKDLKINPKVRYPINALKRLFKFSSEGTNGKPPITDNELIKLCMAISLINFKDKEVLKTQLEGMYATTDETITTYKEIHDAKFLNKLMDTIK